jgi:SAM-dependent methyltransferase
MLGPPPPTARGADRHALYQRAVQNPEQEAPFLRRLHQRLTDRPLRVFREDFCGTAYLASHMVTLHRQIEAIGVDIDPDPLDWGRRHNLARLTPAQAERVTLLEANVLEVDGPPADLLAALNYSYWIFRTREALRGYLAHARSCLAPGGLLVLDVWGGSESQVEQEEEREVDGFRYIWDQDRFDPVHHHLTCKIHFEFEDGTRMRNAFRYDWRLWTLPELRDLLEEVGFREIQVLWEGTDHESGGGNGVYRRVDRGDADRSWLAYIVGRR